MKYFFTSDEHYGHSNVIKYCNRPYTSVEEMNDDLIYKHNEVVTKEDIVIHCGDFTLNKKQYADSIIKRLNGNHIFLRGSHDRWLNGVPDIHERWEKNIDGTYIVCDHYAGRVWPRSHYGSFQCYGHSHANLPPEGLQYDIGVDNNNFYPVSMDKILKIKRSLVSL